MRIPLLIVGLVLLIAGALVCAGVFSVTEHKQVAKLGPLEITSSEEKKPPALLGYVLVGVGVVVLVIGAVAKK
jgi:hypothetical protein